MGQRLIAWTHPAKYFRNKTNYSTGTINTKTSLLLSLLKYNMIGTLVKLTSMFKHFRAEPYVFIARNI